MNSRTISLNEILNTPLNVLIKQTEKDFLLEQEETPDPGPKPADYTDLASDEQQQFRAWYKKTYNKDLSTTAANTIWTDKSEISDTYWTTASVAYDEAKLDMDRASGKEDALVKRGDLPEGWYDEINSWDTKYIYGAALFLLVYWAIPIFRRSVNGVGRLVLNIVLRVLKPLGFVFDMTLGRLIKKTYGEIVTSYRNNAVMRTIRDIDKIEKFILNKIEFGDKQLFGSEELIKKWFGTGLKDRKTILNLTKKMFQLAKNPEVTAAVNRTVMQKADQLFKAGHLRPGHLEQMMTPEAWAKVQGKINQVYNKTLKIKPNHWDKAPKDYTTKWGKDPYKKVKN